ncbi:hypothetical protein LENED_006903 [Lentinula edodes]|uniref:DUF4470 domain-containing protein n=1 Tax=Lentinula edodes TaxID=5353 RepID=A0A1Q3ED26_LENED|nr:hypothetical protein LENED_006903 [Lentinula edodes]
MLREIFLAQDRGLSKYHLSDVSALKEEGNALFKARRFAESAEKYAKAESQTPQDPVFSSNLSAALYELGDYAGCVHAICRAAKKVQALQDDDQEKNLVLLQKLSSRLPKAFIHGILIESIDASSLGLEDDGEKDVLERLRSVGAGTSSSNPDSDTSRLWEQFQRVRDERSAISEVDVVNARHRLADLPIFKKAVSPSKEYYSIGQDEVISLVDDWGALPEEQDPIDLASLSSSQRKNLSFLFAGVGDARHVFGTIIGLKKAHEKLRPAQQKDINVHLTLLDIHPTALARDLCIMMLLDDLIHNAKTPLEEEILAALFYTYAGVVMPDKCAQRLQKTIQKAHDALTRSEPPTQLPSWIHIIPSSIPGLLASLKYWQTIVSSQSRTTRRMVQAHRPISKKATNSFLTGGHPGLDAGFAARMQNNFDSERQAIMNNINQLPEDMLIELIAKAAPTPCPGRDKPRERAKWIEAGKEMSVDMLTDMNEKAGNDGVPPSMDEVSREMENTWKPNYSLFDAWFERPPRDGYPNLATLDAFQLLQQIHGFNKRKGLFDARSSVDEDCPSFSVVSIFFKAVAEAIKILNGKIMFEFLQGDMCHTLAKMRVGDDRPFNFPRKFTRMWLSNVPDYTHGPMNMALYILPNLDDRHLYSAAASNCLLNTGIWASPADFCHTYTLLSVADVPRFLGYRVKHMEPVFGLILLTPPSQPFPLPLSQLASRVELIHWLSRVLVYTLAPPQSRMEAFRVMYPNNLVPFLNILLHLQTVGFPSHWLSEFLHDVLHDRLMSTATPYSGTMPTPIIEAKRVVQRRKLFLDPWKVDWENMLSIAHEALPFPIHVAHDSTSDEICITSQDEIGHYQATVGPSGWCFPTQMMRLNTDQCAVLIFIGPKAQYGADWLAKNMAEVLEGWATRKGDVYVLTVVDEMNMGSSKISWRMRRSRADKMKKEKWTMVPIRFDAREAAANPIPSSKWKEIWSTSQSPIPDLNLELD